MAQMQINPREQSIFEKEITLPKIDFSKGYAELFDYSYKTQAWPLKIIAPVVNTLNKFLYRMTIEGLENVPKGTNCIIMPNHVSHYDSFFVVPPLNKLGPFHFIADEKLFKSPSFTSFARLVNAFPVKKGAKSMHVVDHAINKVKGGSNLLWYPEGQRHKSPEGNECNPGKLGSGMIAHATDVPIIPVFISGPEFAMPVGRGVKFGKPFRSINILVRYGKPVPLDDLRSLPASKETSKRVVNRIIEHIEAMRPKEYNDQSHKL